MSVFAREFIVKKCNKVEYSFNADDDSEVGRQFREWTSEQNDKFDTFIADEVQEHYGLSWQDDGFDEAYDETVQKWYDYYSMGAKGLADFINSFGGDYTATIKEWTEWDCKYWDVDPEELKKDFEEVGMWRGGYI